MYHLLLVCLGGAIGAMARFFLSGFVARRVGETFPWGTMAVNVSGAFAIGVVAHAVARDGMPAIWVFTVTGGLGCYTTVSSFSLQTLALAREGEWRRAGGNVLLSVFLSLGGVTLGFAAGSLLIGGGAP
ncbi:MULTISPECIES: fluoride efflux transporter CrcB [unclassified Mesorhizobium]|uniref:fluoride efflux transporter CrcB n=1 Tax=unclassified Mesorhizobium TaxID=325217 RepID=UPI00333BB101